MKKIIMAALLIIPFLYSSSYAQMEASSPMGVSIKAGIAFPMGDFGDAAGLGAGGEGTFEYLAAPNIGLIANVGYYSFGAKNDTPGLDYSFSTLPVQVGGRYYFSTETFRPYAGAELGLHFLSTKVTTTVPILGNTTSESSESKFGFAPFLGFIYHMPPNLGFDMTAKYVTISTEGSSSSFISIILGAQVAL